MYSEKYYVDVRKGEVVKNLDTRYLAPELYYRYIRGIDNGTIIEKWFGESNGIECYLNFVVSLNTTYDDSNMVRQIHFEVNKFKPCYLDSYTVPPKWFDEMYTDR